ncbi:hypothetical protein CO2235_230133 [Cupriavidus oxalaticus]|uniref:Uncharacterized protein n=1 Tax=Cupriavidus oxalaticus TaxID=96344 RepID=A0A976BDD0_9BURK|nr:hypothetical protein CO2235_230133 [Cupriavidus oxalaticus]
MPYEANSFFVLVARKHYKKDFVSESKKRQAAPVSKSSPSVNQQYVWIDLLNQFLLK